jgi:hypothetical protein
VTGSRGLRKHRHMWTAPWQALFFVLIDIGGSGHMSGLLLRRIWPLALMTFDGPGSDHRGELEAHDG